MNSSPAADHYHPPHCDISGSSDLSSDLTNIRNINQQAYFPIPYPKHHSQNEPCEPHRPHSQIRDQIGRAQDRQMSPPAVVEGLARDILDISLAPALAPQVEKERFPANTKNENGTVGGVETTVSSIYFADKIMITISQAGRLSQWVRSPLVPWFCSSIYISI